MSYRVLCDGYVLHDSNIEQFTLINPTLSIEVNKSGEFSFQIANNHPYYDNIVNKKSYIEIYQDGQWLWSGRPIKVNTALKLVKTVTCEGELSFLHDSNQRIAEYHDISVSDYFTTLIAKHNAMVDESKQFKVGNVTVKDPNDSLYRFSNYEDTFDTIQDKLIDRLGGYVLIRHVDGVRYIDYVASYPYITNQVIEIGSNIIDLSLEESSDTTISALIPLGKKLAEINTDSGAETQEESTGDERLTVESVNGGLDYIVNSDAVERIGMIFDTVTFDDVTDPYNLLNKGYEELTDRIYHTLVISLRIFDRSFIDANMGAFMIGASVVANSPKHGLDHKQMMISKMSISLVDVSKTKIEIGVTKKSLTSDIADSNNKFDTKVETIVSDYVKNEEITVIRPQINEVKSLIEQTADSIRSQVSTEYMRIEEKEEIYNYVSSQILQESDKITISFTDRVTNIENQVVTNQQNIDKYIRFSADGIELGEELSPFKTQITNTRISFFQNGQEVAYISNNKLYITQALFMQKSTIGNETAGYYTWMIRSNGNMSLKWNEKGDD